MDRRFLAAERSTRQRHRLSDRACAARDVALEALQGRICRGNLAIFEGQRVDLDRHAGHARGTVPILGGGAGRRRAGGCRNACAQVPIDHGIGGASTRAYTRVASRRLA
jgi:hypothetical protein